MDFGRMLKEKQFWAGVLLATAGILLGTSYPSWKKSAVFESGMFLKLVTDSFSSRTVLFLIPLGAVLSGSDFYIKERNENFIRMYLVRSSKWEYCKNKVLTAILGGSSVWLMASGISVLLFFILYFGKEEVWNAPEEICISFFLTLFKVMLTGSMAAVLGGICGAVTHCVYFAMGIPFVVQSFLMILKERYLTKMYTLDPAAWIEGKGNWGTGQKGLLLFLILLLCFLAAVYDLILLKRLEEI